MTVTLYISLALPLIIEEEVEVISLLLEQLIGEDIEKIADALLQFRSTSKLDRGWYKAQ